MRSTNISCSCTIIITAPAPVTHALALVTCEFAAIVMNHRQLRSKIPQIQVVTLCVRSHHVYFQIMCIVVQHSTHSDTQHARSSLSQLHQYQLMPRTLPLQHVCATDVCCHGWHSMKSKTMGTSHVQELLGTWVVSVTV